jgi:hypothetical protein
MEPNTRVIFSKHGTVCDVDCSFVYSYGVDTDLVNSHTLFLKHMAKKYTNIYKRVGKSEHFINVYDDTDVKHSRELKVSSDDVAIYEDKSINRPLSNEFTKYVNENEVPDILQPLLADYDYYLHGR